MKQSLKTLLQTNCTLKIVSFLFGYFIWFMYSQSALIQIKRTIPVCFYNNHHATWSAPECIEITLQAKRSDFYHCALDTLAVHINATELKQETNNIIIQESNLFLPETIKMVHCKPQPLPVQPIIKVSA